MLYATQTDLEEKFGTAEIKRLGDKSGNGEIDPGAIDSALIDATAKIDSILGGLYAVPFKKSSPQIQTICCHLARAALYDDNVPKPVSDKKAAAEMWLENIAMRRANILDEDGELIPPRTPIPASGGDASFAFAPGAIKNL